MFKIIYLTTFMLCLLLVQNAKADALTFSYISSNDELEYEQSSNYSKVKFKERISYQAKYNFQFSPSFTIQTSMLISDLKVDAPNSGTISFDKSSQAINEKEVILFNNTKGIIFGVGYGIKDLPYVSHSATTARFTTVEMRSQSFHLGTQSKSDFGNMFFMYSMESFKEGSVDGVALKGERRMFKSTVIFNGINVGAEFGWSNSTLFNLNTTYYESQSITVFKAFLW